MIFVVVLVGVVEVAAVAVAFKVVFVSRAETVTKLPSVSIGSTEVSKLVWRVFLSRKITYIIFTCGLFFLDLQFLCWVYLDFFKSENEMLNDCK